MSVYVHRDNILQKENHLTKYRDELSKQYLAEIRLKYEEWKAANLAISGPIRVCRETDESIITERVRLFNEYKDFLSAALCRTF